MSPQAMVERQQALLNAVTQDPAVATAAAIGAGGSNTRSRTALLHHAQAPKRAPRRRPGDGAATDRPRQPGSRSICRRHRHHHRRRISKTLYQFTSTDADPSELIIGAPLFLDRIKTLRASPTSPPINKMPARCSMSPSSATSLQPRHPALADRQYAQPCFRPAHRLDDVYRAQSVPCRARGRPQVPVRAGSAQRHLCEVVERAQVPLSTLVDSVVKVAPLVVNHQGQFPSVTISFNLVPGTAIGQAVSAIQQVEKELGKPLSLQTSFQGNAQAYGAALASTPILIVAALFVIYIILGVLYESLIHPITIISTLPSAGLGALLLLMAVHYDLSVIAIVGIILLIGIVKKNGIMLVDFAQHVEHNERLTARKRSTRRACCAFGRS